MAYGALSSASERRVDKRDNILFILRNRTVRMDDLPVLFFDIGRVSFSYIHWLGWEQMVQASECRDIYRPIDLAVHCRGCL